MTKEDESAGIFGWMDTIYEDTLQLANKAVDKLDSDSIASLINGDSQKQTNITKTAEQTTDQSPQQQDRVSAFMDTVKQNQGMAIATVATALAAIWLVKKA